MSLFLQRTVARPLTEDPLAPLIMGVDIARQGSDQTVILQRFGSVNPLQRSFFSSIRIPRAVLPLLQSSMASSVV
jgi:hypothetical protein